MPEGPPANSLKSELPIPRDGSIDTEVASFSGRRHGSFQVELDRACDYVVPAQKIFRKRGLPPDLVYVALVESGFVPKAKSRAKAVCMWQIIPCTGARLGLLKNRWVDERCNPMKAAQAAADYLSLLYDDLGNWPLALAAYNAGENRVRVALEQSGLKTFWELSNAGLLPLETRRYVPSVYAAVIIAGAPSRFGFRYKPEHYVARYEKVCVPGGVKLAWVGKKIGVSKSELLDCNPELCKPVTPPSCSQYQLCVPRGCRDDVLAALANGAPHQEAPSRNFTRRFAPSRKTSRGAVHKVGARQTRSGPAAGRKWPARKPSAMNHAKKAQAPKPGRLLKASRIDRARVCKEGVARFLVNGKKGATGGKKGGPRKPVTHKPIHYQIGHGDTLATIARRFHVPVKALCTQNDLRPGRKIHPGTRIVICAEQSGCSRTVGRNE